MSISNVSALVIEAANEGRLEALREVFELVRPLGFDGSKPCRNLRHELANQIAAKIAKAEAQSITEESGS